MNVEYKNAVILEDIKLGSYSNIDNKIINEAKDWTKYLPINEIQASRYFDTWNCVAFSALNCIEIYFKYLIVNNLISKENINWLKEKGYLINGEVNFSDRFIGVKSGTKVGIGNSGSNVRNAISEYGLIPEQMFSLNSEDKYVKDYYTETTKEMNELGKEFNKRFKINGNGIFLNIDMLKYGVVQVYVLAWYINNLGQYYNPKNSVNHAATKIREVEKQIFDHYAPFIKTLVTDYYYYPTGYQYTVNEIINHMNIKQFLKDNDLLFVRNTKTGQFGRIMQEKLKVVNTSDRGVLMLLDEAVRTNGRGLSNEEWNLLTKEDF